MNARDNYMKIYKDMKYSHKILIQNLGSKDTR